MSPEAASADRPSMLRVLRHRNYALVAGGNFVNQLGMWARIIGISWAAQELTDSTALIGAAFGAQFIPSLLVGPFAGLVADRYDRRLVAIAGNLGMAVPTALLALLVHTEHLTLPLLLLLALAGGVLQSFTQPAANALVRHLVPLDEVQSAVALNSILSNVSRFIGAAMVGWIIATFGTATAFLFNTMSFFVVVAAWLAVRLPDMKVPERDEDPFLRQLSAGLRFARGQRAVRSLLLLTVIMGLMVMHLPLLGLVSSELLGAGASAYGLLHAAIGVGAIAGVLVAGRTTTDGGRRLVASVAVLLVGTAVTGLSFSRSLPLSLACQAMYGAGLFITMTTSLTVITLSSPNALLGRVMGLHTMAFVGMVPINGFAAGALASWLGVAWTIGLGGAVLFLYGIWFVAFRRDVLVPVRVEELVVEAQPSPLEGVHEPARSAEMATPTLAPGGAGV